MHDKLLERIPKIPHWRWILFSGEDHPDMCDELLQAERFAEEEGYSLGVRGHEDDINFKRAIKIKDQYPIKDIIEKLLLERCKLKDIRDIVYQKFKDTLSVEAIKFYRDFFFDVEIMSNYDIANYFEENGISYKFPQSPPPVPGNWREQYLIYKNGGMAEVDMEEAIQHIFVDSLFRAAELSEFGWRGDEKKLKFQKAAMDAYKTLVAAKKGGRVELPDAFNVEVFYPESTAVDYTSLDGDFDINEDPNEESE